MEPLSSIPVGVRYYFGAEARLRRRVEDAAMRVFERRAYEEIVTPSVDYFALFDRGMGHGEAQRAFRFTDTDGRMLALRPDVTSTIARAAATLFAARPRPLRLCYASTVFRQRPRSHAEWRREWTQVGCELIGANSTRADAEVLTVAAEILNDLDLRGRFRVTLNHVGIFNGFAAQLGLDAEAREQLRRIVDARDAAELRQFLGARAALAEQTSLARLLQRPGGGRELIDEARDLAGNESSRAALDALAELFDALDARGLADCFEIDLCDVSGLDYYTGLVFKIYLAGAGTRIGGGGRYDELTASFGQSEPAVGFALDLDALTEVIAEGMRDEG